MPAFTNNLEIVMLQTGKVLQIPVGGGIGCKHMQDITIGKFANLFLTSISGSGQRRPARRVECRIPPKALVTQDGMLGHRGRIHTKTQTQNMIVAKTRRHFAESFCILTMRNNRCRTAHQTQVCYAGHCFWFCAFVPYDSGQRATTAGIG